MFFGRWYHLYEEDIGELTFLRFLKYSHGIMLFESAAYDKASPPAFGKKEDGRKFYQNIEKKLDNIWSSMFPKSTKSKEETVNAMLVFKAKQEKRKAGNG